MNVQHNTIVLLVGPSNCGKSYLANRLVQEHGAQHVEVVSSDTIRRNLLGMDLHKWAPRMLQVSSAAFKLLYAQVDALTSYPVNKSVVLVDTKGLDGRFRNRIYEIAVKNQYSVVTVVFAYKNWDEYYEHIEEADLEQFSGTKSFIAKDVKKLNERVLPDLVREPCKVVRLRSKEEADAFDLGFMADEGLRVSSTLPLYAIGDIHGQYDAFIELLGKCGAEITDGQIVSAPCVFVLIGDYVDKGPGSIEIVKFIFRNLGYFRLIMGNHENRLYRQLMGTLEPDSRYCDSYEAFLADPEAASQFKFLAMESVSFVDRGDVIITHAPCKEKYLGKSDSISSRKQRTFLRPHRHEFTSDEEFVAATEKVLSFVKDEDRFNHPLHICGHIAVARPFVYNNRMFLDTGAGQNNLLTAVYLPVRGKQEFISVQIADKPSEFLPRLFTQVEQKVDLFSLDPKEARRVRGIARNKVNFISGTMSPADKSEDVLESLEQALAYYRSNGVDKVVLQKKYMGSRCNLYLHDNPAESYCVTRRGYKMRTDGIDLLPVYTQMRARLADLFSQGAKIVILDGEILPWCVLGEGLIEKSFKPVGSALKVEADFLASSGFYEMYRCLSVQAELDLPDMQLPKEEALSIFGQHKYGVYTAWNEYRPRFYGQEERQGYAETYNKQMDLYGSQGPVEYRAFQILKIVYENREAVLPLDNFDAFYLVNNDDFYCIKSDEIEKAQGFFERVCDLEQKEGIVVKPLKDKPGVAPYMKVRNPEYLNIVYGPDYRRKTKYTKLLAQKRVDRKIRTSIKEWELGKKMLAIPYAAISETNAEFINLASALALEQIYEEKLDPRL